MSVENGECLELDECNEAGDVPSKMAQHIIHSGVWDGDRKPLDCDGVIRYDREELVSYFLAFASPEELTNHKQVYSIQPLPPDTLGLSAAERLNDVNSTAVLSYQRAQRERDSNSTRRRKNRTSIRLDEEGGVVDEDWWTPMTKDRKSAGLTLRKKSDSPKRKELGSVVTPGASQPLFDDFTFDFEEEEDDNETSFISRGGFFGKSLSSTRPAGEVPVAPAAGSLEPIERPPPPQSAPPPPPAFAPPPPPSGLQSLGRSVGSAFVSGSLAPRRTDAGHEIPTSPAAIDLYQPQQSVKIGSVSPVRSGAVVAALNEIGSLGSPASRKGGSLGSPSSRHEVATDVGAGTSYGRRDSLEAVLSFLPPSQKASAGFALPSSASRAVKSPSASTSFEPDATELRLRCWRYRDPQGVVQGPFSTLEMQHWNDLGYFSANLPLQHVERMGPFLPLKAIFPKGVQPFRAPPLKHVSAEVLEECQREEQEKGQRADKEAAMQGAQASQAYQQPGAIADSHSQAQPAPPQHALHNIHQLHQQHLAAHQYGALPQHAAAAARQKQAAQVHAAQQVAVAAHHAALHSTNTHNAYSGSHDYGSAKHRLEQQSANIIKNLLHMHQPDDVAKVGGLGGLPSSHQPNDRSKQQRGDRSSAGAPGDKNKRDRRKKDKEDLDESRKEQAYAPPPAKPMLQSTQEFPSLGASFSGVNNLESSHSLASLPPKCAEPEGFWERPPRPMGPVIVPEPNEEIPKAAITPMAGTSAGSVPSKEPDLALDKAAKQLPRRKRGKGVAADPNMLGFVATHRGVSIEHGD